MYYDTRIHEHQGHYKILTKFDPFVETVVGKMHTDSHFRKLICHYKTTFSQYLF